MKKEIILENALSYALKKGADQCEIFAVNSSSERYVLEDKALADVNGSKSQGFSIRLLKNGVLGFSYGAVAEKNVMEKAIDDALVSCKFLDSEPYYHFTPHGLIYPNVPWEAQEEVGFKEKEEFLYALKSATLKNKKVKKIDRASLGSAKVTTIIKNTLGLDLTFNANYVTGSVVAISQTATETETGGDAMAKRLFSQLDADKIGANAGFNAVNKLNAITVKTGEYPVIIDGDAVVDFLGIILPSFLGDNIRKGQSKLAEKIGEIITHRDLTLCDNPLLPWGIASNSFDDQGTPCGKNILIDHGKVKSFLYDTVAAAKADVKPTGNGFANSAKSLPTTGFTNYYIKSGKDTLQSMVKGIKSGIYIRDLMGLHMANPISGDFSLGVRGNLITNGEMATAISGNMVAGNVFQLLRDVEAVGDEIKFYGYRGAPPLKISSMKISGKT
ncbi:MAG: TldD/PmbA family protein [Clostridiales bacterium]